MKKLLAILIAGAFASSAFAVDASAPMEKPAAAKASASSGKHKKHHNKKQHKSHKAASAA